MFTWHNRNMHTLRVSSSFAVVVAFLLVVFFLLAPLASYAQEIVDTKSAPLPAPLISCFDETLKGYEYGSVNVTSVPTLTQVSQGSELSIVTTLTNNNAHPIIDAQVYVRIFRTDKTEKNVSGPRIVDQFVAVEGIVLAANTTEHVSFSWQVPKDAEPGEYSVASYVQSAKRFNLQGLSFTSDVTGGQSVFTVVGETKGTIFLDNESITLNGEPYQVIGIIPYVESKDTTVPVTAMVKNTSLSPGRGTVTWRLYSWDGLNDKNLIDTKTETVKIHPESELALRYDISNDQFPIYYLTAELEINGAKSYINVRYTHINSDTDLTKPIVINPESARMNDLGVNQYPITKDSSAYVCMHELLEMPNDAEYRSEGKVELIVRGLNGGPTIASKTYEGYIPWEISALPLPLSNLTEPLTNFEVVGRIYLKNELIDEVTLKYTCNELGVACPSAPPAPITADTFPFSKMTLLALGSACVLAIYLAYSMSRRKKVPSSFNSGNSI